jgi:hypothetical protein
MLMRVRGIGKDNGRYGILRSIDKRDNPQHYQEEQEQKMNQKRNRGMSR